MLYFLAVQVAAKCGYIVLLTDDAHGGACRARLCPAACLLLIPALVVFPFLKRETTIAGPGTFFFERQHLLPKGRGGVPGGRAEFFLKEKKESPPQAPKFFIHILCS